MTLPDSDVYYYIEAIIFSVCALAISIVLNIHQFNLRRKRKPFEDVSEIIAEPAVDENSTIITTSLNDSLQMQVTLTEQLKSLTGLFHDGNSQNFNAREKALMQTIVSLEHSYKNSKAHILEINKQLQQAKSDIQHSRAQKNNTETTDALGINALDLSKNKATTLSNEVNDLSLEINSLKERNKRQQRLINALEGELKELKESHNDLQELEFVKASLKSTEEQLERSEAERIMLESNVLQLDMKSQEVDALKEQIARMHREYELLERRFVEGYND